MLSEPGRPAGGQSFACEVSYQNLDLQSPLIWPTPATSSCGLKGTPALSWFIEPQITGSSCKTSSLQASPTAFLHLQKRRCIARRLRWNSLSQLTNGAHRSEEPSGRGKRGLCIGLAHSGSRGFRRFIACSLLCGNEERARSAVGCACRFHSHGGLSLFYNRGLRDGAAFEFASARSEGGCFRCPCGGRHRFGRGFSRPRCSCCRRSGPVCRQWHPGESSSWISLGRHLGGPFSRRTSVGSSRLDIFFCRNQQLLLRGRRRSGVSWGGAESKGKSKGEGPSQGQKAFTYAGSRAHPADSSGHSCPVASDANPSRRASQDVADGIWSRPQSTCQSSSSTCGDVYAKLCKADGTSSSDKRSSSCSACSGCCWHCGGSACSCPFDSWRSRSCWRSFGCCSSRAEQGFDEFGGPSFRRRSSHRCPQHVIRNFVSRSSRPRETSKGISRSVRRFLADGCAECLQEIEASFSFASVPCRSCRYGLFYAAVSEGVRRLWQHKGTWADSVCFGFCGGRRGETGDGRHSRTLGLTPGRVGTSLNGPESMGPSVPIDAVGGSSSGGILLPWCSCLSSFDRTSPILCSSMSAAMDNHRTCLCEGNRLYSESSNRGGKEGSSTPTRSGTFPKAEGKIPKRKRRRCRPTTSEGMRIEDDCFKAETKEESSSLFGPWPLGDFTREEEVVSSSHDEVHGHGTIKKNWRKGLTSRSISLHAWSWGIVRKILCSKTQLAFFVRTCIRGCSVSPFEEVSSALFPIPLPRDGLWRDGPRRLGVQRRKKEAVKRIVHIIVMALNFLHGGRSPSDALLTRRRPGPLHLRVYERLAAFVRASGPSCLISVAGCGRKSFQLVARFEELFRCMQRLGLDSTSAYHQGAEGKDIPIHNEEDELRPYRPLDAGRLKLSGRGEWNCSRFLSPLFYMPFMEPRINQFVLTPPTEVIPNLQQVDREEVVKLCHVWDQQGLLRVFPRSCGPKEEWGFVKIFNNYKAPDKDRQIGDRRGMNYSNGRIQGVSKTLPTSSVLLQLAPVRFEEQLRGSIADRRDFYHQFWVTDQRSSTNALYPPLSSKELSGLIAYEKRIAEEGALKKKRRSREKVGDFLHLPVNQRGQKDYAEEYIACFGGILQGDHLGVEIATDAHIGLLQEYGRLSHESRLTSDSFLLQDACADGLVIDDYFVISREEVRRSSSDLSSLSARALAVAKEAYADHLLQGSDDKDVLGAACFKVCGAEIISGYDNVREGLVSCGSPYEKRFALALMTAAVAAGPYTSDSLHACMIGSWISMAMMRRQMMSLFYDVFKIIDYEDFNGEAPRLRRLSRSAAQEMLLASALAPVFASNLSVPFLSTIFSTDASLEKGGITACEFENDLVEVAWRSADIKGGNVPLLTSSQAILSAHDDLFEEVGESRRGDECSAENGDGQGIERPLGLRFQLIEVCGGAGTVTRRLVTMAIACGPVFDLAINPCYDMADLLVLRWLYFMLESGRLMSVLVSPPCTTFSPAAYPPLRSYQIPMGFNLKDERTLQGNRLANAALSLVFVGLRTRSFVLAEQPRRSKMRWLGQWRRLLELGAKQVHLASCAYGSPHQKEFTFLGSHMAVHLLHRRCPRNHTHLRIQGGLTKAAAVYCDGLADALAELFRAHLSAKEAAEQRLQINVGGLEDQLSNEICLAGRWRPFQSWRWKKDSHINILEAHAVLRMLRSVAHEGGDARLVYMCDSHVARSVISRGRSSASSLRPVLEKITAVCVAFGLYPRGRFAPTRMNSADHPTRDAEIPEAVRGFRDEGLPRSWIGAMAKIKSLRRWASNWARLTLLLQPSLLDVIASPSSYRSNAPSPIAFSDWTLDFDSTLGLPGEGPPIWIFAVLICNVWGSLSRVSAVAVSHGDRVRKAARQGVELVSGRRVTETTAFTREALIKRFGDWIAEKGFSLEEMLKANPVDVDAVNEWLVSYGRWLFSEGKPYYHYAETINSVAASRPALRRSLQQSWDLAFVWGSHEPTEHHQAMPPQILIALVSLAWTWGWKVEAAILALAWGALLRIGEVLQSFRADLILPEDIGNTVTYILLRIREPKTRFRMARHQAGKLEQADLVQIVTIGFRKFEKHQKLWAWSGATLRNRLERLLMRLHLPTLPHQFPKPLSLASLRPGGATWLIGETESPETVRRKGRWQSFRTMDIYLQEVSATTYMNDISPEAKKLVLSAFDFFPIVFKQVLKFDRCCIPEATWYFLFTQEAWDSPKGRMGEMGIWNSLPALPYERDYAPLRKCVQLEPLTSKSDCCMFLILKSPTNQPLHLQSCFLSFSISWCAGHLK